jgi:predicted dehydrogenase
MATLASCVGKFREFSAVVSRQYDTVRITDSGEVRPKTTPDHIVFSGLLENGAAAGVVVRGGASRTSGVRVEINGSEGDLVMASSGRTNIHRAELDLIGGRGGTLEPMPLPEEYQGPSAAVSPEVGVAKMYEAFESAIRRQGPSPSDFAAALYWHRMIDLIQRSSDTGLRQRMPSD